jgi:hypothetical protein
MRDSLLPDPASAAAERERAIALLDAAATVAPIRARASLRDCALLQRRAGSGGGPGPEHAQALAGKTPALEDAEVKLREAMALDADLGSRRVRGVSLVMEPGSPASLGTPHADKKYCSTFCRIKTTFCAGLGAPAEHGAAVVGAGICHAALCQ